MLTNFLLLYPQIFLATKFAAYVAPDGTRSVRNDPEYIHEACEKSLKRLGVDYIDLYYCHRFSGKVPAETIISTMKELVKYARSFLVPIESSWFCLVSGLLITTTTSTERAK